MSELLKKRALEKYYLAIVEGVMKQPRVIRGYLIKDEKTNQVTVYPDDGEGRSYIETGYAPLADNGRIRSAVIWAVSGIRCSGIRNMEGKDTRGYPVIFFIPVRSISLSWKSLLTGWEADALRRLSHQCLKK